MHPRVFPRFRPQISISLLALAAWSLIQAQDLRATKEYAHPGKLAVLVVENRPRLQIPLDALGMGAPKTINITIPMPAGASSEQVGAQ